MIGINVDMTAIVKFTNKLEKLSHTTMPNVARKTLNRLAMDVKQRTMPRQASRFTKREKNFFKVTSKVNFAKGNRLDSLFAEVGFTTKKQKFSSQAVEDLEQQEHGGVIKNRKYIAMSSARTSKNRNKRVQKRNRLRGIKIVKDNFLKNHQSIF